MIKNSLDIKPNMTKSMTTTVGIKLRNHVILGADKRATAGIYIAHKKVEKIHLITDYMAITISGLVADAQYIVDEARITAKYYELSSNMKPSVKVVATFIANILSSYLRIYPFIVQLIIGGYDTEPRLYYIDLFGSMSEEKYVAAGSGSPTALGVLEKNYDENLSLDEGKKLVRDAIKAAIGRDIFSGEGVDIIVIGREGYSKETLWLK